MNFVVCASSDFIGSDLTSAMKRIRNDSDGKIIDKLNLSAGLKELVAGHGFTINQLLCMKSGDIADTLRIDQDAARLIVSVVRKSTAAFEATIKL